MGESFASLASTSRSASPRAAQPGEGAFLRSVPPHVPTSQLRPQPGDGAYLASQRQDRSGSQQHRQSNGNINGNGHPIRYREPRMNGEAPNGRSGDGHAQAQGRSRGGGGTRMRGAGRPRPIVPTSANAHDTDVPHLIDGLSSNSYPPQQEGQHSQQQRAPPPHYAHGNGNGRPQRPQSRPRGVAPPDRHDHIEQGTRLNEAARPTALDPAAQSFTPGTVVSVSDLNGGGIENGVEGGLGTGSTSAATITNGDGGEMRTSKKKTKKSTRNREKRGAETTAAAPTATSPAQLGRRAAFQQSTKLTQAKSRTSDEGVAASVSTADAKPNGNGNGNGRGQSKKDEPDDLVSRLTRGLRNRPFLECPICFNSINPSQPTWCCLPPDHPPEPKSATGTLTPSINPITGSTSSSNHYSACYTPFHLDCIRNWARRNLAEEEERARNAGREGDEIGWRCPGCQKRRADSVAGYRCFCGRLSHPPTSTIAPHSCGESCARKRPNCSHSCPLACHPGPCPPCQVALIVPCPSHHIHLTVKCSAATSNNAALSPVCDEPCHKQLNCGNKNHTCQSLCHYGECKPCDQTEAAKCYCGSEEKEVECGWGRKDERICAALVQDGDKETWVGKYDCGKECDRLYDCGVHPCKETCHPHPIHPLPCPRSPNAITHCPCGATPLSSLPGYPRPDCLASIPTCASKCPKARPCGHPCPRKCHTGDCPPCHEEVIKTCRCGQSQLLVPCDELREKAEHGETEVTCERVCRALRNCGRHECGRTCCPLWEQAKFKRQRRTDDHDLYPDDDLHKCHLTCGKMLSCGLHTCPKPDHKGPCGRCLQASYDELICHCGETVIYPPVACGTTINCPYPCDRPPPACGHPKTQHSCHEQTDCPPCPYLTTKPCACGKDPSVKNVRCSQEKVSCGQACGELLGCGYHRCAKLCHRRDVGDCESCVQVCGKPKKICKHPCTAMCHAPARCPETDPCQAIVTQTCACGHLQTRTSCGASSTNSKSREVEQLKCNSECAVRQRNARLADALGISKPNERGQQEVYEDELKSFALGNHGFVRTVEKTFEEFFKGPRQSTILPHMPPAKRTFVMSLAEHYRLTRELIDQEPNRSVQIRRRVDTRVPSPLLSAAVQPLSAPSTTTPSNQSRLVTNLGWGRSASSFGAGVGGTNTAATILAGNSHAYTPSGWASVTSSAAPSARPSRTATPVPVFVPAAAPIVQEQERLATVHTRIAPRGNVAGDGGDDWDVDV